MQALQHGTVPAILITGGKGHSTIHLYNAVRRHPIWHNINTAEGRYEAEVLQEISEALGVTPQQLLPLEVESLNCGGNAECSKKLADKLAPKSVIIVQVRHILQSVEMVLICESCCWQASCGCCDFIMA